MKMKQTISLLPMRVGLYEKYLAISQKTKPTKRQHLFRQKLELMTYRNDFQDEVAFFRTHFGIPKLGFSDFASCYKWADNIVDDPKKYADKDPLLAYAKLKEGKVYSPAQQYSEMLRGLLRTFWIKERWFEAVEYYILFNKTDAHELLPKTVVVSFTPDKITGENILSLQIFSDTEQSDILDWWKTIENFQGIAKAHTGLDMQKQKDTLSSIQRDVLPAVQKQKSKKVRVRAEVAVDKARTAYFLRKEGKTYEEIRKVIGCMQGQVGTYIKRFQRIVDEVRLD